MAEEKVGKAPEGEGGKSTEGEEVAGKGQAYWLCRICRRGGWVPNHWRYFNCWNCGAFNRTY